MKKKLIPYLLILCLVITMIPFATMEASAATKGTADAMVSAATNVAGKSKSSLGLKGEWCASFVYYCAKKSGNTGKIGSSTYVGTQAKQTVNDKGGTITFVNKAAYNACKGRFKSSRCKYNPSYVPKKGDLYIQKGEDHGDQYFAHVGIVRKNSSKNTIAYTLEGNTGCDDGKHKNYNNVEYKTRNKNGFRAPYGFSAFVTPNYTKSSSQKITWTVKYNANGGKGSMADTKHTYGVKSNLRKNTFTRTGYTFNNWYVYRPNVKKWMYTNGSKSGWYAKGSQPSGYYLNTYYDGGWVSGTTNVNNDTVVLYAKWKANTWTTKYNANGGNGSMADTKHTYGQKTYLRKNTFTKSGYTFKSWYAYRPSDKKWMYTNGDSAAWYTKGSQPSKYYLKPYNDGGWVVTTTAKNNDTVVMYANWQKVATPTGATVTKSGVTYPTSITQGNSFVLKGKVSSNKTIDKIEIGIVNASSNSWVSGQKVTQNPKAKSYDILKNADSKIIFGKLSPGTYYYRCWAHSGGKAYKVFDYKFTVKKQTKVSYSWPSSTHKITGNWGLESGHKQKYHYGIDIGAAGGSAVKASAPGTVIYSGIYQGYGYCVQIKHSDGKVTLYGHMRNSLKVKKGATVSRGQVVGYVGGTGANGKKVYAEHLHFGIYKNASALSKEYGSTASAVSYNPLNYLPK